MTRIALAQFEASDDKEENMNTILEFLRQASRKRVALCAFPEFMMFDAPSIRAEQLRSVAEPIGGHFVNTICDAAKKHSIQVVGTFYEKCEFDTRVFDTAFHCSGTGHIMSYYRKTHLYDALGVLESARFAPGESLPFLYDSAVGKTGLLVCYDLRFPELARGLACAGAHALIAPSAWVAGDQKTEHWKIMNRARAIENGCYVISPDQTGNRYCGHSMVVDPYGRTILEMETAGLGIVDVDLDVVEKTRKNMPLIGSRRTDLYPDFG